MKDEVIKVDNGISKNSFHKVKTIKKEYILKEVKIRKIIIFLIYDVLKIRQK